jgi:hypothetical protein
LLILFNCYNSQIRKKSKFTLKYGENCHDLLIFTK